MRLKISHTTSYHYDTPVPYALQQLRLRPKSRANQVVENWDITIEGGCLAADCATLYYGPDADLPEAEQANL